VSNCCLLPNEQIFSSTTTRTTYSQICILWSSFGQMKNDRSCIYYPYIRLEVVVSFLCSSIISYVNIIKGECKLIIYILTMYVYCVPYLGLYNARPLLALKISRKKLYNAHGLLKKLYIPYLGFYNAQDFFQIL
jgi:hypothetical protein